MRPLSDSSTGELAKLIAFAVFAVVSIIAGIAKKRANQPSKEADADAREFTFELRELKGAPPRNQPPPPPKPVGPPPQKRKARAAGSAAPRNELAGWNTVDSRERPARVSMEGPFTVAATPHSQLRAARPAASPQQKATERPLPDSGSEYALPDSYSRSAIRRAVIMAEVLGAPVSLRDNWMGHERSN
jgi:hypothetical protein